MSENDTDTGVIELLKQRQESVQEEKQDAIEEGDEVQELYSVGKEDGLGYAIELLEQSLEDDTLSTGGEQDV